MTSGVDKSKSHSNNNNNNNNNGKHKDLWDTKVWALYFRWKNFSISNETHRGTRGIIFFLSLFFVFAVFAQSIIQSDCKIIREAWMSSDDFVYYVHVISMFVYKQ